MSIARPLADDDFQRHSVWSWPTGVRYILCIFFCGLAAAAIAAAVVDSMAEAQVQHLPRIITVDK
jgi:hypothetical protein